MTCSKAQEHKKQLIPFHWSEVPQAAINKLVSISCEAPVLAYADYIKPFLLHNDASLGGLGAVLYQKQEGERVIVYVSRGLTLSEWNYPVHKLEFLALKWAVTDNFHDYLYEN